MENKYNYSPIPVFYSGIEFRSRLEAKWAAFFDLMGWAYIYEPDDFEGWSPDFKLITGLGREFYVEVKPSDMIRSDKLRARLGKASGCANNILLLDNSPFVSAITNIIGMVSIGEGLFINDKGNEDFEFCTGRVLDPYGGGMSVYNFCSEEEPLDQPYNAKDICSEKWKEAGNIVQFLKPRR